MTSITIINAGIKTLSNLLCYYVSVVFVQWKVEPARLEKAPGGFNSINRKEVRLAPQ